MSAKEVFPPVCSGRRRLSPAAFQRGLVSGARWRPPSGTQAHSAGESGGLDSVFQNFSPIPRAGVFAGFFSLSLLPRCVRNGQTNAT